MNTEVKVLTAVEIVFFDLDDTLCAYWEASKKALRDTFQAHLLPGRTAEEMVQTWAAAFRDFSPSIKQTNWYGSYLRKGESTRNEQMRLMLARFGISDDALAKRLGDMYASERLSNLSLFSDALEVLNSLQGRFPLGIITNGPADVQRAEIEALGIGHYFDHVYIEGEMGKGKPLPEVFEMIAGEVGKQGKQILFVGNSYRHDIEPAIVAGWHTIWIRRPSDTPPSSSNEHPEDKPSGAPSPDATVGSLSEILPMLGPSFAG